MEILPVDLTELVAAVLGISIVLIPVLGLTARFAFKPVVEALGRTFENRQLAETLEILHRRLELQEHQIETLQTAVRRLDEVGEFHRRLERGTVAGEEPAGDHGPPA